MKRAILRAVHKDCFNEVYVFFIYMVTAAVCVLHKIYFGE